jgi:hypothetical protein
MLLADGTVMAWGQNSSGELGNGTTTDSNVPVAVSGLSNIVGVSAGYNHSLAVDANGDVWAWGDNTYGEVESGLGTTVTTPVEVYSPSLADSATAIAVSAGEGYSLDLIDSYNVVTQSNIVTIGAWGWDNLGQTGGAGFAGNIPVVAVSAGGSHGLAILDGGEMYAWGANNWDQLGNGTLTNSSTPVVVDATGSYTAVAGGGSFSLALRNDGTVWAWGNNTFGQIGSGSLVDVSYYPVQVSVLDGGVASIAANSYDSLAVAPQVTTGEISGVVTLYGSVTESEPIQFTLHSLGGAQRWAQTLTLNSDGSYTLPNIPVGIYTLGIKGSRWLRSTVTSVTVGASQASASATLTPGDLNGDNVIDLNDFALFAAAYGSEPTSPNWNPNADLNCDGEVNIEDFSLLAQFFGETGGPAP